MALRKGGSVADIKELEKVEQISRIYMDKYHGCAQCVHMAIQEVSGLKDEGTIKAISGFSGGIGGIQSVCGALTGAALALGLKYGRDVNTLQGPPEASMKKQGEAIEQVARLAKWFEREFGNIECGELRKSHMGTELGMGVPWQQEWANSLGMGERCKDIVARTARRTIAMLDNPKLNIMDVT
jgi:C_GCAxxG_C_C family probable redox protein